MAKLLLLAYVAICQTVIKVQPTIVDPSQWSYYEVHRTKAPITIDGVLTEEEWGHAPETSPFREVFQPGDLQEARTTAKLLWDDKYLYVAFICWDDDIWSNYTKFDDPVYAEEAAEIFIDPEGCGRHYWEIDISPRNVVVDLNITRAGFQAKAATLARYNVKGLKTGVKVYGTLDNRNDKDEKWTAEMAIPWLDFKGRKVNVPPKIGDSWRANMFRCERAGPAKEDDQFLSWSLSPGVFHQPKNFGVLVFCK